MIFSESDIFFEFRLQKRENPALWMSDYVNISFFNIFPFTSKVGTNDDMAPPS